MKVKDGVAQPWGPYTLDTRKSLLRGLLEVQKKVGKAGTNRGGDLINRDELEAIRNLWRTEEGDWSDSVPAIYKEVVGEDIPWLRYEVPAFSAEELLVLNAICDEHGVSSEMLAKLIEVERSLQGMSRRASIQRKLSAVLEEDWRTHDEIIPINTGA